MIDLYTRILLWHKLVAMQTGGLALCSAKHRLNRAEAMGWVTALRNVSDDIEAFLDTGEFILDSKGQREVKSDLVSQRGNAPDNNQALTRNRGTSGIRKATRKS